VPAAKAANPVSRTPAADAQLASRAAIRYTPRADRFRVTTRASLSALAHGGNPGALAMKAAHEAGISGRFVLAKF
jgi:hypothetical protein